MVYAKFQLEPIIVKGTTLYGKATAIGEKYDKHKHGAKVEVKAVTYHRMAIKRDENVTVLTFILDL
jgi:SHS2 domain-containing protein